MKVVLVLRWLASPYNLHRLDHVDEKLPPHQH